MSKIEAIRRRITRNYCRAILWVDDEIKFFDEDPVRSERCKNLFFHTSQAIQEQGFLLQPIGHTDATGDPDGEPEELNSIKRLARSADVLILDWHLAGNNPAHCVNIIDSLLGERGTRFIIVLTQHKDVQEEFAAAFEIRFPINGNFAHAAGGKHAAFLPKPREGGALAAGSILETLYELIADAYPDYIHWAALEMAGNIKRFTPKWLESIPSGMDWALLSEYCHDGDQASDIVVGNLLEDLGHAIDINQLESAKADNCKGDDWPGLCEIDNDIQGVTRQLMTLELPAPKIRSDILAGFAGSTNRQVIAFVESQKALATFCENISLNSDSNSSVRPGTILVSERQQGFREIYVCVSQACDCRHRDQLLIVRGKKTRSTKLGSTIASFQNKCYRFEPETANLKHLSIKTEDGRRLPDGYKIVGHLRSAAAGRLASRFWNYMTRSAVNIPAYTRAERSGE